MGKTMEPVAPVGDPFLVIELCRKADKDFQQVAVVASLPGRDGTRVYRYHIGHQGVTDADLRAIQTDVLALTLEAVTAWCGIQAVLEM